MRIIAKPQSELWSEGLTSGSEVPESEEEEGDEEGNGDLFEGASTGGYTAGKWGRYLRAPDLYFELMNEFRSKFVRLREIVEVRFGVKSGCDAFFMPRNDSEDALNEFQEPKEFKRNFGVDRDDVISGKVCIIRDGNDQRFPIETEFLKPEVHSIIQLDRPVVTKSQLDRVVLLVSKPMSELAGTHVGKYLRHGQNTVYASEKSKAVPVPQRSSCAGRDPWYDLTRISKPGFALWTKATQYRPIVIFNPSRFIANCRLYDLSALPNSEWDVEAFTGVLNSTIVAYWRTFYGRYTGTEGSLDNQVIDVLLTEVPDIRTAAPAVIEDIRSAFRKLIKRPSGNFVEQQLMDCRSPERARRIAEGPISLPDELINADRQQLDDAVLRMLGMNDSTRRRSFLNRLYDEVALHFRQIRVVEIIKNEQKSSSKARKLGADELAADVWDAATQTLMDLRPARDWLSAEFALEYKCEIPDGVPKLKPRNDPFDATLVYFGKDPKNHLNFPSREHAELIELLARFGVTGPTALPKGQSEARHAKSGLESRLAVAQKLLDGLAENRAGKDDDLKHEILNLTLRWFMGGRQVSNVAP